jgi:hypothetical protein
VNDSNISLKKMRLHRDTNTLYNQVHILTSKAPRSYIIINRYHEIVAIHGQTNLTLLPQLCCLTLRTNSIKSRDLFITQSPSKSLNIFSRMLSVPHTHQRRNVMDHIVIQRHSSNRNMSRSCNIIQNVQHRAVVLHRIAGELIRAGRTFAIGGVIPRKPTLRERRVALEDNVVGFARSQQALDFRLAAHHVVLTLGASERHAVLGQLGLHFEHFVFAVIGDSDSLHEALIDAVGKALGDGRDGLRVDGAVDHVDVHALEAGALETALESRERRIAPVGNDLRGVRHDPKFRLHDEVIARQTFDERAADALAFAGAVDLRGVDVVDSVGVEDFPSFLHVGQLGVVPVESGFVSPGPGADDKAGGYLPR